MNQEKIGQFIKKIREENKLTQKELADKLGVTFQAVSKWENGKNVPDISILKEMSEMFNVDIDEILDGEKKNKKKTNYAYPIGLVLILIALLLFGMIYYNNDDYEFKTISSKCSDFKITGSAAYNKDKVSNCDTKKNSNLEDFLKDVNINVEHFSKSCKNLNKNNLTLEIEAKDTNNKTITYTIPIKLNDSCK